MGLNQSSNPTPPSNNAYKPPPTPTGPPIIGRCIAMYPYPQPNAPQNPGDCVFDRNDTIDIYSHDNEDWCRGINQRTRSEGLFPRAYVQIQHDFVPGSVPPMYQSENQQPSYYGDNKGEGQNPYDTPVPPMAVSQQNVNGNGKPQGKTSENGKKFGKKLGNATIFGAGATIGGNLVNSIF